MKLFVCVAFLCVLVGAASAQDTAVGILIQSDTTPVECTAATFGMICDSCTTGIVCQGVTKLGAANCASPNAFCDKETNACTATASEACAVTFKCPSEGFFPDPTNCDIYYLCDADLAASQYQCPTNYVFNVAANNCKRKAVSSDCATMKCTKANEFIVYSKDAAYYAFCDSTLTPQVFKCPNPGEQFVKTAFGCQFICKAEGNYPGPTESTYYLCYKSGSKLLFTKYDCPTGYTFDTTLKYCTKPAAAATL